MVHNLILDWSMHVKGMKNSYCLGVAEGLKLTAWKEKEEERRAVEERERQELAAREKTEALKRTEEIERLHHQPEFGDDSDSDSDSDAIWACLPLEEAGSPEASKDETLSSSDDIDDEVQPTFSAAYEQPIDLEADFEAELQKIIKSEGTQEVALAEVPFTNSTEQGSIKAEEQQAGGGNNSVKKEETASDSSAVKLEDLPGSTASFSSSSSSSSSSADVQLSLWQNPQQLILFRDTARKIAEDYLADRKIKLGRRRRREWRVTDETAYQTGRKDSKKIDVKRRRITDGK